MDSPSHIGQKGSSDNLQDGQQKSDHQTEFGHANGGGESISKEDASENTEGSGN